MESNQVSLTLFQRIELKTHQGGSVGSLHMLCGSLGVGVFGFVNQRVASSGITEVNGNVLHLSLRPYGSPHRYGNSFIFTASLHRVVFYLLWEHPVGTFISHSPKTLIT